MSNLNGAISAGLSCSVCHEVFDGGKHTPRALQCHHTFCQCCISGLAHQHDMLKVNCPKCRAETIVPGADVSQIFCNFQLLEAVEAIQSHISAGITQKRCEVCDDEHFATHRCDQCAQYLCDQATAVHSKIKATCKHSVQTVAEFDSRDQGQLDQKTALASPPSPSPELAANEAAIKAAVSACQEVHKADRVDWEETISSMMAHYCSEEGWPLCGSCSRFSNGLKLLTLEVVPLTEAQFCLEKHDRMYDIHQTILRRRLKNYINLLPADLEQMPDVGPETVGKITDVLMSSSSAAMKQLLSSPGTLRGAIFAAAGRLRTEK